MEQIITGFCVLNMPVLNYRQNHKLRSLLVTASKSASKNSYFPFIMGHMNVWNRGGAGKTSWGHQVYGCRVGDVDICSISAR